MPSDWFESLAQEDQDAIGKIVADDVMKYVKEHNIDLPDEMLDAVAGGVNPFAAFYEMFVRRR